MGTGFVKVYPIDKTLAQYHTEGMMVTPEKARELFESGIVIYDTAELKKPEPIQTDIDYLRRVKFQARHPKPRVLWLQDMSRLGGAELSNCMVVNVGMDCGFDIVGLTPGNFNIGLMEQADIVIVNNFFEFNLDQFNLICDYLFEKRIPFVKYDHDHRELKRLNISRNLFTQSRWNFFLSPFHLENHEEAIGNIKSHSSWLPLAIDTEQFSFPEHNGKEKNSVFIPTYQKCNVAAARYIKENPEKKFYVAGRTADTFPDNVTVLGKMKNPEMVSHYQRAEYVFHRPNAIGAGERVLLEGALCGCKLIADDKSGHWSWLKHFKYHDQKALREMLNSSIFEFWKVVHKCLS